MEKVIRVGMADLNICKAPDRITTLGLGSCIGLVLFDVNSTTCGMVHVMLPDSSIMRNTSNPAKFADTGVKLLVEQLEREGLRRNKLCAKMAGGAKMFSIREAVMCLISEKEMPRQSKAFLMRCVFRSSHRTAEALTEGR